MSDISNTELHISRFSPFLSLETSPSVNGFRNLFQVRDEIPAKYLRDDREY